MKNLQKLFVGVVLVSSVFYIYTNVLAAKTKPVVKETSVVTEKKLDIKNGYQWDISPEHSSVGFSVKHLVVSNVKGNFKKFEGSLVGEENGHLTSIEGKVDINSINTENAKRDTHLKSDDFFDAKKYPSMTFKSTAITYDVNKVTVTGNLTMKGVTKEVIFTGEFAGKTVANFGGGDIAVIGYSFTGVISRKDFNMKFAALMNGNVVVSDEVKLSLELEANHSLAVTTAPVKK